MEFKQRYANLNAAQKQAVDTIDGPVMVIAGPGTGKTELLSVRAANILLRTDTLPENILCLTFTESGADAMRQRLVEIIGKDAYRVAIHTFHSFGVEVINQNGQFFYHGANFRPADELSSYQILRKIFDELEYNNPIAGKINDEYTYLPDVQTAISELKKSGLTSDELLQILDENDAAIDLAEQLLSPIFNDRIDKKTANKLTTQISPIRECKDDTSLPSITPLSLIIADSLDIAINQASIDKSTKPITTWRNEWLKKDAQGRFVLKTRERQVKLRALSYIYERYLALMQEASLYDFDDMILRVVHATEVFDDLRYNLQEKYQYIMVDEFQDTNMAQMRILNSLTSSIVSGDMPNILVVGDDDQAIYSFQGAEISNILDFQKNYPKAKLITLTNNYRSYSNILSQSREVIIQGRERLENIIDQLDKNLIAQNTSNNKCVQLFEAETSADERHWLANSIKSRIKSGQKPDSITVITRRHKEIELLLPYFFKNKISVNYEKRENILDQEPIIFIEKIARLLIDIMRGKHDSVNASLPELLAHQMWGIRPIDLWKISLEAYNKRTNWLDIMNQTPDLIPISNWMITTAALIENTPLEQILDIIIGKVENESDTYISPLFNFYFSPKSIDSNPDEYLAHLEALRTIRAKLREYLPNETPTLTSFIDFINLNRKIGAHISSIRKPTTNENSINIMTAHKSKGLEFDTVYIFNAVDNVWGQKARSRNRLIGYPENLAIAPAGETNDERLRLLYVAMTRAKKELIISCSNYDDSGKSTLRASSILGEKWQTMPINSSSETKTQAEAAELAWYQPIIKPVTSNMRDLLTPILQNYKLSATHLNNFIDVTRGGPATFLMHNLLKFPQAKSPNAAFGTAIHDTLQRAHTHLLATGERQAIEDIVSNFEHNLRAQHLSNIDFDIYLQKGSDVINKFLESKYDSFTSSQQTELSFASQNSVIGEARITGSLDLVDVDKNEKTIVVTDYKTGKPSNSWLGKSDHEKIKLHKYKQQLMFYKLLVENARDYRGYLVTSGIMQYVEPNLLGEIISIEIDFNQEELEKFAKLINIIWHHIVSLDLPDVSGFEQNYRGIISFEQYLLDKT